MAINLHIAVDVLDSKFTKGVLSMNVAYVRVSTMEQNEGRQVAALGSYEIDKWFTEKCSGKNSNREQLKAMIDFVRENDVVYTESFSRIARNTKDLLDIVETIEKKGAIVKSLKENLDTATPTGKLMLTMIGAMATFEREIMLERQREGISIAKSAGKYKGRQSAAKPANWEQLLDQYKSRAITATELAHRCGVSRPVIYKWLKQ